MTKQQIEAAIKMTAALAETIMELGSVPSGHLYARVMGYLSLEGYNGIIKTLKGAKLVKEENNVLTWIGPVLK